MKATTVFISLFIVFNSFSQMNETSQEWKNFDLMADYLSKGGGKWTGENKNYNPSNPRSPKAFGLWFARPIRSLMTLTIVAYVNDTIRISSQGTFNWHPIEQKIIHSMSDRGNGYSEGITSFPNDTTFISVMKIFRPNGSSYDHKDENFIVSENVHRNTSFGKDESGNWTKKGDWVWRRDSED